MLMDFLLIKKINNKCTLKLKKIIMKTKFHCSILILKKSKVNQIKKEKRGKKLKANTTKNKSKQKHNPYLLPI